MVQRRACLKPFQLIGGHRVLGWDLKGLSLTCCDLDFDGGTWLSLEEIGKADGLERGSRFYPGVISFVFEP